MRSLVLIKLFASNSRVKRNAPITQKASSPSNQINFGNALPLWTRDPINDT